MKASSTIRECGIDSDTGQGPGAFDKSIERALEVSVESTGLMVSCLD